ncbi:MAG: COX15/CtaA family protein, partial [Paraperlucidibaca sp.]
LGAWTRLRDAGLGCPDWPTCYGHLTVPSSPESLARAEVLYPGMVVEPAKAWPETIHRYFAAGIGFVILLLATFCWRHRRETTMPWRHALALLVLVCVQGAFGALTVTEKLYPPVVTLHLLFGFSTLTGLFWLLLRVRRAFEPTGDRGVARVGPWLGLAMAALVCQIILGGWTASNYAATVCTDLPICQPGWQQAWSPAEAFSVFHADDQSYEFAPHLGPAEKITIHASHRLGAFVVTGLFIVLIAQLMRLAQATRYRAFALALSVGLLVQIGLGITNVVAGLPLWNAVAHNVWAAILLQLLVALAYAIHREKRMGGYSW